jgi:hypothetical protein
MSFTPDVLRRIEHMEQALIGTWELANDIGNGFNQYFHNSSCTTLLSRRFVLYRSATRGRHP